MAERKVLNKYYPPDFDPAKLPKLKLDKDRQYVVRLMAPFNMRCTTCGEYIYKGKKFNARKETVQNETYLGLEIYRFYIRCPRCISEITFKTDPENTDYVAEKGATRNFQAIKRLEDEEERLKKEREEEELNNPMKIKSALNFNMRKNRKKRFKLEKNIQALENRTKESKQEMNILEKLEELRDLNARHASVDHEKLLEQNMKYAKEIEARQEQEDEELVQSVFGPKRVQISESSDSSDDEEFSKRNLKRPHSGNNLTEKVNATDILVQASETKSEPSEKKSRSWEKSVGSLNKVSVGSLIKNKKKLSGSLVKNKTQPSKVTEPTITVVTSNSNNTNNSAGGLCLLGNYSSSDSSDET